MATEAQIAANRLNALTSTRPEGKAMMRRGTLAREAAAIERQLGRAKAMIEVLIGSASSVGSAGKSSKTTKPSPRSSSLRRHQRAGRGWALRCA